MRWQHWGRAAWVSCGLVLFVTCVGVAYQMGVSQRPSAQGTPPEPRETATPGPASSPVSAATPAASANSDAPVARPDVVAPEPKGEAPKVDLATAKPADIARPGQSLQTWTNSLGMKFVRGRKGVRTIS
jgi:hypothetical protein